MPFGAPWQVLPHTLSQRVLSLPPGLLVVLVVWTLVWKGLALWRAARAGQSAWFVAFLAVNNAGVLEIAYLAFFAPRPRPDLPAGRTAVAGTANTPPVAGRVDEELRARS
jgi:methionyl-tRNA synthetase